jgi:hypothetical protein
METTIDLYEALQQLPNSAAAKQIADYMEQGKQLNLERMKEIFMTKDDKIELFKRIEEIKLSMVKWYLGIGLSQLAIILGFLYFILKQPKP